MQIIWSEQRVIQNQRGMQGQDQTVQLKVILNTTLEAFCDVKKDKYKEPRRNKQVT